MSRASIILAGYKTSVFTIMYSVTIIKTAILVCPVWRAKKVGKSNRKNLTKFKRDKSKDKMIYIYIKI